MPVKDVKLGGGHAVEGAFHDRYGFKVAAYIEHETAPAKAWDIVDIYGRQHAGSVLRGSELQEGFQPVHCAQVVGCGQGDLFGGHAELVAFVFVNGLQGRTRRGDVDEKRGMVGSWMIDCRAQDFSAASSAEAD
jgi:hypothetical protein